MPQGRPATCYDRDPTAPLGSMDNPVPYDWLGAPPATAPKPQTSPPRISAMVPPSGIPVLANSWPPLVFSAVPQAEVYQGDLWQFPTAIFDDPRASPPPPQVNHVANVTTPRPLSPTRSAKPVRHVRFAPLPQEATGKTTPSPKKNESKKQREKSRAQKDKSCTEGPSCRCSNER